MPNYGLVTDIKKYGAGSLRTPFDTSQNKALRIDPQGSTTFWMSAGQDFYLSAWIRYGTVNVATLGVKYPIIRYGGASTEFGAPYGWEIGIRTISIGGSNTAVPYFAYNNQIINTTFDGTNGNTISPSSSAFDHYEVYRSNNTITFKFTNSSNIANITTASYNLNIGQLAADYYTNAIFVGSEQPSVINQDNGAYIDELFFAKDTSQVTSRYPDSSIADGGLSTTVFLLNFDNSLRDDTGPVTTSASLTATTSLTATGQQFEGTLIDLTAVSTIDCSVTKIPGNIFSANLASSFAQSALAARIARTTINLSAFNTELVVGSKAIGAIASLTAQSSLTATGSILGARPLALTAVGSTSFVTSPKVLGTHSVRLLNASSYLISESATTRLNMLANENFVIEFLYNPQYAQANNNPRLIAGFYNQVDGSTIWSIETNTNRYLQFKYLTTSGLQTLTADQTANPLQSTSTWYWISVSRTNNQLKIKQRGFSVSFGNNQAGENNNSSTVTVSSRIGNSNTLGRLRLGGTAEPANYGFGYYDEFFMARGTGEFTTTNDANQWSNLSSFQVINLGAADTTQALYHWDNALTDSTTGIKTATATLTSRFSQQATTGKLASGQAVISSSSNLTVLVRKIAEVNAVLVTNTQVLAQVTRTKSTTAAISSNFTQAAAVVATREFNLAIEAQINLSITASRIRSSLITLQAFNTELIIGSNIIRARAAITVTSQLVCNAVKNVTHQGQANLTLNTGLVCTALKSVTHQGSAILIASSSQTAIAGAQRASARANLTTRVLWSYIYDKTQPLNQAQDLWIIPADTRMYVIPVSTANWTIEPDLTAYIIEKDVREYKITPAGTEFTIEG